MSGVFFILNCIYYGVMMIFLVDLNFVIIWDKIEEEKIIMMFVFFVVYSYMFDELNKKECNILIFKVV